MIVSAVGVFVGPVVTTFALSLAAIAGRSDRRIEEMAREGYESPKWADDIDG